MAQSSRIYLPSRTRTVLRSVAAMLVFFYLDSGHVRASSSPTALLQSTEEPKNLNELGGEETKRQMLNVLGIDELPQPRHGIIPHKYMIRIYQKMSSRKFEYKGVNTIRGFVDIGHADSSRRVKFHQIYGFNISALPRSEKIISADLRLLRVPTGQEWRYGWAHGMKYRANLYYRKSEDLVWNGRLYKHTRLMFLGSVPFDIRDVGENWKVFNVVKPLRTWQNDTSFVHNFEVQVESVKTGYLMPSYAFGLSENGRAHYKRALLVSFTDDGRVQASEEDEPGQGGRRSGKKSKSGKRRGKTEKKEKKRIKRDGRRRRRRKQLCSKKSLYVDFRLLGWSDWIIAPPGYNAYFCQGLCKFPIPEHLKPTNHAMVQTTVHYVQRRRVPPACCVPHKLSGLSMLFIDKGNSVVYKKYDNMIVESCGCK